MKSYKLTTTLALGLLFAACSKDRNSGTAPTGTDSTALTVGKKGADFSTSTTNGTWNSDVIKLKSHWFYTWGTDMPGQSPQNCEFVSMFWGKGNVTDDNITYVKQLAAAGKVKYILGFNEPDRPDQSNLSVADAIALWPKLESIGLPIGSPAVAWPTIQWFDDFMTQVAAQHRRVDFICVHMYVGTDDKSFVQVLQDLYNKYHLPIWITEFATVDNNATSMATNMYKPADALGFMQRLLPQLDTLGFVQRYSWFSGDPKSNNLWPSALVDASGNLTELGSWYANYKPNTMIK